MYPIHGTGAIHRTGVAKGGRLFHGHRFVSAALEGPAPGGRNGGEHLPELWPAVHGSSCDLVQKLRDHARRILRCSLGREPIPASRGSAPTTCAHAEYAGVQGGRPRRREDRRQGAAINPREQPHGGLAGGGARRRGCKDAGHRDVPAGARTLRATGILRGTSIDDPSPVAARHGFFSGARCGDLGVWRRPNRWLHGADGGCHA
mmetsp:Transcript_127529/g.366881  ORF Transcript_127529/g.366881 Transcript_127529/m.366881 type:complete len:204 (-) Transcript_127529:171-782(-)